ncbi:MAG TPA: copper-binding protein, partial [Pyrinomonadaceae bacterium]|nr:copper-binding protein [Pyrinomonadaceae bacterium]
MYKLVLFALVLALSIFSACKKAETSTASPNAKRYPFKGEVVSVNKEKKTAVIDHDDIPGYMDAMTMEFPIHEDWVWDDLTPGS